MALYLLAIKDTAAKRRRLPTVIAKCSDDDKDLLCPYNALRDWQQLRRREMAQYSEQEREDAPLFTVVGPEAPYPFFPDEARQSEQERVVDAVRHGQWLYSDIAIMDAPGQQTSSTCSAYRISSSSGSGGSNNAATTLANTRRVLRQWRLQQ